MKNKHIDLSMGGRSESELDLLANAYSERGGTPTRVFKGMKSGLDSRLSNAKKLDVVSSAVTSLLLKN